MLDQIKLILIAGQSMGGGLYSGWLLRDDFTADLAAGSVDGTLATDGVNVRVDPGGDLTIVDGNLVDGLRLSYSVAFDVERGTILSSRVYCDDGTEQYHFGWDNNTTSSLTKGVISYLSEKIYGGSTTFGPLADLTGQTHGYRWLSFAVGEVRSWVILDGVLLGFTSVFPGHGLSYVGRYTGGRPLDSLSIPDKLWLPRPVLSDTGTSAAVDGDYFSDGEGHAEGVAGGIGSGGADIEWHGPTWVNGSTGASNYPTTSDELLDEPLFDSAGDWNLGGQWAVSGGEAVKASSAAWGNLRQAIGLSANAWYRLSVVQSSWTIGSWYLRVGNSGPAVYGASDLGEYVVTGRQAGSSTDFYLVSQNTIMSLSEASAKQILAADLFRSIADLASPYAYASADWIIESGTQAGLVLCLDDADDPQNFIIVYHDGATKIYIEKCVGGTYTTLATVSATYSAGATLTARTLPDGDDVSLWIWYGGYYIANYTITDAGIVGNELHGLFSTHGNNEVTNVAIYKAKGHNIPGTA